LTIAGCRSPGAATIPPMQLADRYAQLRPPPRDRLQERPLLAVPRKLPEMEIQAHWFAGDFGTRFKTTDGDGVEIVQFGVWNHEAGPDFAEAAIAINGGAPARGCIEFDPDARDWERHGHAQNPDYEAVVLHVFASHGPTRFFTRTAQNRNVPQVLLDLRSLDEPPNPQPQAKLGRCTGPLRDLPEEKARTILRGASQFRLQKKAARIARLTSLHGSDEALYQSLATTLGYKSNKLPFTLIAQRLPLRTLLQNKPDAEAILFGVSAFLNSADLSQFDRETRVWLRELWEKWWQRRAEFERLAVARGDWRISGQRPANHPQRRVAALAQIVRHWPKIRALARSCDLAAIRSFFASLHDEYWDFHYTLTSAKSPKPMALVGDTRVTEMLANVFFPLAILNEPSRWTDYEKLPATLTNRRVEIAAIRLLGDNPLRAALLKTAANQQGLLQIYEDFCMRDASDCAQCLFPKQLAQW
jgi:uncharacterized protein DUF2851